MTLDLDLVLLGLTGAAFLVTGCMLLRNPAIARAQILAAHSDFAQQEALANAERSALAVKVAEQETERVRRELQKSKLREEEVQALQEELAAQKRYQKELEEQGKTALIELEAERERSKQAMTRNEECSKQMELEREKIRSELQQTQEKLQKLQKSPPPSTHEKAIIQGLEQRLKLSEQRASELEAAQKKISALERMLEGSRARARDLQKELDGRKNS